MNGDLIMTIGVAGLTVSALPGIIDNFRKHIGFNFWTSLLIVISLVPVIIGAFMLGAFMTSVLTSAQAAMWAVITLQSYYWGRGESNAIH